MDTANKRASAILIGLPFRGMLPIPDASIDAGDRAQVAFMYRGLLDEGVEPEPGGASEWLITARRRGSR